MDSKVGKLEQKKQSYEKPQLTKHGSVEQVTGGAVVSGFADDSTSG